jgi:hypothetical protein
VFEPSPLVQIALQRAAANAHKAEELAKNTISERKIANALNVLEQVSEAGHLAMWVIDALRPLVGFHTEHRVPEMIAEPIRLAPNYTIFLEIQFFGGCFDKKVLTSGSPELDVNRARLLLLLVGSYIANSEKENKKPANYLTWRQPVPEIVALAKEKGWPQEKREKDMRYHVYQVTSYEETENTVRFKAYYQGIE